MNKKKAVIIAVSCVAVIAIVVAIIFIVKGKAGYRQVKVDDVKGDVLVVRDKGDEVDAFEGMKLVSKDEVQVDEDSSIVLLVDDDKHIAAEENTKFVIVATGSARKGEVNIELLEGDALFTIDNKLPDNSTFEVSTPNATFCVRGTEFEVSYDAENDITTLEVFDGVVKVKYEGDFDTENVEAGENRVITEDERYTGSIADALATILGIVTDGGDAIATDAGDGSATDSSVSASSDIVVPGVANDPSSIRDGYAQVVSNMRDYVAGCSRLDEEYISYDYMFFDYDLDGLKELVLYLGFNDEENEFYRDTVFLNYDPNNQKIYICAIVNDEYNDTHFYAEYNGRMARYSWRTSPYESYIYGVYVQDDSLMYVLEGAYDEIFSDLEAAGLHPLPLYGEWEILLPEIEVEQ